ncbi:MAG: T9SS type A sorting domain-containing protein [Flavobacteriales bacterium]|nr:T9SS type A sorting domain-containing protein [Flavobacteriales bacterium]
MNKFYSFLAALAVFSVSAKAQDIQLPPSWHYSDDLITMPGTVTVESFDHDALLTEDTHIEEAGGRTNNGRLAFHEINIATDGVWNEMPDGSKIWLFKYKTEGALATSAYFTDFNLPIGGELYIWSADKSYAEGPYDWKENNGHGRFGTAEVFGDEAVIEYYQPADVVGEATFKTYAFAHFYRYIYNVSEEWSRGGSDPCEVDVNCPEGDGWDGMRDAVVRLRIVDGQFVGLCSGSLVNTTARDCRQYMLTALHCADGVSDADFQLLQVRFNYERPQCGTGGAATTHQRTGVIHLADSNDGGGNSGSDFLLVEIEDEIQSSWDPFYAGWDATGSGSTQGVGIHHPAGDVKKISTYTSSLSSAWWGYPGSHWEVNWVATVTNHGVTEGGSSGSPLFNKDLQIVGTLTGGSSYCSAPNDPDYYGKMSEHWDGNNNPTDDLKVFLDNANTNEETLFGNYAPDCDQEWLEAEEVQFSDLGIYPNPTAGDIRIELKRSFGLDHVTIYDTMGHLVEQRDLSQGQMELSLGSLSEGIYFLTFQFDNGQQVTKKVTKM